jgi:hypothetical protein
VFGQAPTAGRLLTVNADMQVSSTEQSIPVPQSAPLIDVTTALVGDTVSDREFLQMPKTRSYQSVALTAAYVNQGGPEGAMRINGASGAENQCFMDGISTK